MHASPVAPRGLFCHGCGCAGAVVTHLYAREAKAAWLLFQDALAVDCFVSSEEAFAADALFEAYRCV
jgi:hypothetical protein